MAKENQISIIVRALMYCGALTAGVLLIASKSCTPVEASGYISPFLVIFEGQQRRSLSDR
ncbi:hypothetical protein ACQEVX_05195 [Streptomyces syringium]|uniref:hypothetical protein n=1 Tax=Streptomyces syringium TaxID=76729 RepID=UPI003D8AAFFE